MWPHVAISDAFQAANFADVGVCWNVQNRASQCDVANCRAQSPLLEASFGRACCNCFIRKERRLRLLRFDEMKHDVC